VRGGLASAEEDAPAAALGHDIALDFLNSLPRRIAWTLRQRRSPPGDEHIAPRGFPLVVPYPIPSTVWQRPITRAGMP
jgi:hypothetical protein